MNQRILSRHILITSLCALLVALSSGAWSADLPMAQPESVGVSSERLQRIDDYFQRFVDNGQIAGAVSLVARNGKVVHHSAVG